MARTLICVVGSDRSDADVANAREVGRLVAREGWVVVTGGRASGVMDAASAGAKDAGGLTVGILPDRHAAVSQFVDIPIMTDLHNARNNVNVISGRAVIACGARGAGTVSEIALALKNDVPVVLLGCDDLAVQFLRSIGDLRVAKSPAEAIAAVKEVIES
jgi:hypothetical protein